MEVGASLSTHRMESDHLPTGIKLSVCITIGETRYRGVNACPGMRVNPRDGMYIRSQGRKSR